jgi:hypothetical protein
METFIVLGPEDRLLYCRQASELLPFALPAAVVEKDFWVSWLLKLLMELPESRGRLTFKGGTSLSKAWNLIDRFSEDIDLALDRSLFGQAPPHGAEDAPSNTKRKDRIEELNEASAAWTKTTLIPAMRARIAEQLPGEGWTLEPKVKGNEVNIEFRYPGSLQGELGSLLPVVLVELVPRADDQPNGPRTITPLVYEALSELLGVASFEVPTLAPERTLLEKAMYLHETVAGFNAGSERKSRHYYDLSKLISAGFGDSAMVDRALFEMVIAHRRTFYRYNALDYDGILRNGIMIVPPEAHWPDWRGDYDRTGAMIYRDRPTFDELMKAAHAYQEKFNAWVRGTV